MFSTYYTIVQRINTRENQMDNVMNFPTQAIRDKVIIERTLKGLLLDSPLEPNEQEELTRRCLAIWEKYQHSFPLQFSLPFPPSLTQSEIDEINLSLNESVQCFAKLFHDHMNTILIERFNAEFKIYLSERSS